MSELDKAEEELKRADHLVYVTLKYTRTCDVILNIIKRLISAYNSITDEALEYAKKKRKIKEIPFRYEEKIELLQKICKVYGIKSYFTLYSLMIEIEEARFSTREEFRKNVTLISHLDNRTFDVNMLTVFDFYEKTKEFVKIIRTWMEK